ncbi:TetR family transcriptional regulator [Paenibacillus sp. PK3_47]|uniref:TetR/AcrR family transcriptional regulator n=1 Tax=Paenibacillus sp. PK3_47 TaxID=2072642 RepID=UPI00201D8A4E|nr:TetR/AcrR family transcriptional regulator [Paenibacillus sp. PK3_47]UQZ37041.1 TetR family transcriptional regulator [Paenibacillus sp. PK3_47]
MSPRAGLDTHSLVKTAAELADEQGIEAVTLAALAARLGVRSPSLYNHVKGLAGLRTLMAVYGLDQLYTGMSEALEGLSGDAAVHAIGQAYVGFARQHPGLYETTLKAPEQGDTELKEASERILSLIIQVLAGYRLGEEGSIHAVRGFRSILHGFTSIENKGGFGLPVNLEDSLARLINTYLSGIHCMGSEGKDHQ